MQGQEVVDLDVDLYSCRMLSRWSALYVFRFTDAGVVVDLGTHGCTNCPYQSTLRSAMLCSTGQNVLQKKQTIKLFQQLLTLI